MPIHISIKPNPDKAPRVNWLRSRAQRPGWDLSKLFSVQILVHGETVRNTPTVMQKIARIASDNRFVHTVSCDTGRRDAAPLGPGESMESPPNGKLRVGLTRDGFFLESGNESGGNPIQGHSKASKLITVAKL
jgi:hypothetical protein